MNKVLSGVRGAANGVRQVTGGRRAAQGAGGYGLARWLLPAALLASACLLSLPAGAATITTATVTSTNTFNVISSPLGGISGCAIRPGLHSYGTSSFTASEAAAYSFTGIARTGTSDPFLALYKGSFDPANPLANLVGCDDDSAGDLNPRFTLTLEAATTYVMVATEYQANQFSGTVTFSTGIIPNITLSPQSSPVGGIGLSMPATSNSSGALTYSSSDTSVATIDPDTGALTLLAEGSTTITVRQAAEADPLPYAAGVQTAELTVTAAPPPVVNQPIPTLSEWALIVMACVMAGLGMFMVRRRF